jgi:vitamin B12 transporter
MTRLASAIAAASITAIPAYAQTNNELEPVIVTATRIEQKLSDVIPSASVITREEIERAQAPTFVDLIQSQPGVEIGRNGGPGTVSSIFMRGQASANVAVFIDGVPVQRDSYGGLKLVDIPPSQIERIEILRGNMGAIYGEAAVGGAIHIFTRAGTASSGPTGSASYGSRNTSDLAAGYNLNGNDYKLGFSVQRYESDGYSAMNPSQNPTTVNPDEDGFERESFFVHGEKAINDTITLGFQANQINSEIEYDNTSNPSWGAASPTDLQHAEQKSSDLVIYSQLNPSSKWSSRITLTQSDFENRDFYNGAANGSYDGDQLSLQWSNAYQVGPGTASFGIDLTDAEFETPTKYERDSRGYYAGYNGRLDQLDYQANVRRDEVEANDSSTVNKKSANTWLLGAGYHITNAFKLTGLISTSFRAPAVGDLYGSYGNPGLQPQEHKGFEIGAHYQLAEIGLGLNYFSTETKNEFGYGNDYKPYNIAKTENDGFELTLDGAIADINYKVSSVFQDPRNGETNDRLARRAKEYGAVEISKSAFGIDWASQINWSGNRTDPTADLDSYTIVNLTAAKKLAPEWTARVKLENAFDEDYQLAYGYDAVPRGVFFSIQYQPK